MNHSPTEGFANYFDNPSQLLSSHQIDRAGPKHRLAAQFFFYGGSVYRNIWFFGGVYSKVC